MLPVEYTAIGTSTLAVDLPDLYADPLTANRVPVEVARAHQAHAPARRFRSGGHWADRCAGMTVALTAALGFCNMLLHLLLHWLFSFALALVA